MDNFKDLVIKVPGSILTFYGSTDIKTKKILLSPKLSNFKSIEENEVLARAFGCLTCKMMYKLDNTYVLKVESDTLRECDRKNILYTKLPTGSGEKEYYIMEM